MTPLPASFLSRPLAHRGLHDRAQGRVENAPRAFQAAIDAGFGIELDVQLSRDGQAIVFHDYDLGRLTGTNGAVAQKTATELRQIQLLDTDDHIPTLPMVLDQIRGQVPVLIEIKDQDGAMGPNIGPLERAVADALTTYRGDVAVMSFNPHAIEMIAPLIPNRSVGLVTDNFEAENWPLLPSERRAELRNIPDFDRLNCGFISHNVTQLDSPAVARIKGPVSCWPVLCWTVRSADQEKTARQIADNITFEGYLPKPDRA